MARDFDGTNDEVVYGSDASIDEFVVKSGAMWIVEDGTSGGDLLMAKSTESAAWALNILGAGSGVRYLVFDQGFSVTGGQWTTTAGSVVPGTRQHVAFVYDNSSVSNDPLIYIDGVSQSLTEVSTPTLTASLDAAQSLVQGETSGGTNDFDGRQGWFCYHNAAFAAADVNRAMWWGRPFGGLKVYHPLVTSKVTNEGTATADGTPAGTTVASLLAPVVRPGSALMGMGIGW